MLPEVVWCGQAAKPQDDDVFKRIVTFKLGQDAKDMNAVSDLVVRSLNDAQERKRIEKRLIAVLGVPNATFECKQFVCRQLFTIGTSDSIPALVALLPDKDLSHMALYALGRMPGAEAATALRKGLTTLQGQPLIGVINCLGERGDPDSAAALIRLLKGNDAEVAMAAASALGKIGGDAAAAALAAVRPNADPKLRAVVDDAWLRCADRFLALGDRAKAQAIYEAMYAPSEKKHLRAAALRGLIALGGDKAVSMVLAALSGGDAGPRAVALGYIREIPGAAATKAFAEQLPKLSPEVQALLLDALADRGDAAAGPAAVAATKSSDGRVRVAALRALAKLGDASSVALLGKSAAGADAAEADAARFSLSFLRGQGVDSAILDGLKDTDPKVRVELIKAIYSRRPAAALPALLKAAQDADVAVRQEAFKALGSLADEKTLPDLVGMLVKAKEEPERGALEKAVMTIAGKVKDEQARTSAVLAAVPTASGPGKAALLRILARFGGDKPLEAVRGALKDPDPQVQDAAIRSLADWPDAAPADTLLDIAKTAPNETHRVLALRGYVRLIALPGDRPVSDVLKRFEDTLRLATRVEDKKLVLAAVADVHHPDALKLLEPYIADAALRAEAEAAAKKIKDGMNAPPKLTASVNPDNAKNAMDGNPESRWDTSRPQDGGEWFMLELGMEKEISKITLDSAKSAGDYPRGYEVYISRDGKSWGRPVAKGEGKTPVVEIAFKPIFGRFIKIVQTGKADGLFWSIHELKLEAK
jgi:HEAT repeat protein